MDILARQSTAKRLAWKRSKTIYHSPWATEFSVGRQSDKWVFTKENMTLRETGVAHEIINTNHTGYYCDSFYDEVFTPEVWQLPTRKGEQLFLAGYREPSGNILLAATNHKLDTYDSKEDAARAADDFARYNAEEEREFDERYQEASRLHQKAENKREKLAEIRAEAKQVVADIRTAGTLPSLCTNLKRLRKEFTSNLRKLRIHLEGIEDEFKADFP